MSDEWLTEFILIFKPEYSTIYNENYPDVIESANKKLPFPIKALFWTMVSIAAGLAIGQLH